MVHFLIIGSLAFLAGFGVFGASFIEAGLLLSCVIVNKAGRSHELKKTDFEHAAPKQYSVVLFLGCHFWTEYAGLPGCGFTV